MLTPDAALDRLDTLLALAKRAGADAADAVYMGEASVGIGVRLSKLEDVGRSEGEEIGLRLFIGQRSAQVSVSDLSPAALAEACARAAAMAAEAPEDAYAGLAPEDRLFRGERRDFDLFDPLVEALHPDRLRDMALEAEDSARAVQGISNSEGGSASAGTSVSALATSHGFRGSARGSSVSVSAVVVSGAGSGMQRDYAYHQCRHLEDLDAPATIGTLAGERTVARLDSVKPPTGKIPLIFDKRVSASLIGHLLGAISGSSIARKTSFLLDRAGTRILPEALSVVDDPHRARGLRSRSFDGEGVATSPRRIVDKGILTGWLVESASGRQLGLPPTGHASRGTSGPPGVSASNLWLEGGCVKRQALLADVKLGLYITELIGMGVNGLTGDYSRGAGGFMVRDGALAEPVSEATIAGNLLDMLLAMVAADDLEHRFAMNAPTIRIDGMMVAGQ
jgi:PmbA protein